ncbi:hypothetical protein Tco_0004567 [Tanacetum coccineum]
MNPQRHGQTFNWQTATFEKVENYEDEDDCSIDFETEFPAIVFDNKLTIIPSEPTVSPSNENEVDFRISLDESDDEDYTVILDENSFSYKIIPVNDLKTDSGNDKPLSPNPTVDYFDDLDYFKDFENKFPAIIYNGGLTSKSDLEIKPLVSSERIDEFNLIDEASLSEYDEEIVSCFNDLFNIIHPDDSKSEKDNDDNDIGSFVMNLKVNIVIWEYYVNIILFFLIINLYVPFGIPFDPKRYDRDGSHTKVAEAKAGSDRLIPDKGDLRDYWIEISSDRDFLAAPPLLVSYREPCRRLCHLMIAYRHAEGRKSGARLSGGHFIRRLAMYFGLINGEGLRGPRGQQAAATGTHEADEAGQAVEEVAQEIPAPS